MKKTWIWITIGVIVALIVGGVIGAMAFPKTINVPTDSGEFCYDTDQLYYIANSVKTLPSDWEIFVVGQDVQNIGSQLCLNVNQDKSKCAIVDICPNCVTNKISCICQK